MHSDKLVDPRRPVRPVRLGWLIRAACTLIRRFRLSNSHGLASRDA
jgi:hypothetical protein